MQIRMNIFNPISFIRSFRTRVMLALIFSIILTILLSDILIYKRALKFQLEQIRKVMLIVVQSIALGVDSEKVDAVPMDGTGAQAKEYKTIENKLRNIKDIAPALEYIYILKKSDQPGMARFVVDIKSGRGASSKPTAQPGDSYNIARFPTISQAFDRPAVEDALVSDEWGVFLSAYAPIKDDDGKTVAVLGIDMGARDLHMLQKDVRRKFAMALIVGILLAIVLGSIISRGVTKPVETLIAGTRQIAAGNLSYEVKVKSRDEIAELAGAFNKMSRDLVKYIADLKRTTAEKERLIKELEIAKEIQMSFLPKTAPAIKGVGISAATFPARIVGGDFYDFIPVTKDKWGITVADVSGKGMPAALFMALSRTVLKTSAAGNESIVDAIKRANNIICAESTSNLFVTLFYAIFNSTTKSLEYLNAGHNPPLLVAGSAKDIILLKAQGVPLGLIEDAEMSSSTVELKPGDLLAIYTDGAVEAVNVKKEQFGIERLEKIISDNKHLEPEDIVKKAEEAVRIFAGNAPQFDDITLMVVKILQ